MVKGLFEVRFCGNLSGKLTLKRNTKMTKKSEKNGLGLHLGLQLGLQNVVNFCVVQGGYLYNFYFLNGIF